MSKPIAVGYMIGTRYLSVLLWFNYKHVFIKSTLGSAFCRIIAHARAEAGEVMLTLRCFTFNYVGDGIQGVHILIFRGAYCLKE